MFTGVLLDSGPALSQPDHLVCLVPVTLGVFDTIVRIKLVNMVHFKLYVFVVSIWSTVSNSTGFIKQMFYYPAVSADQLAGSSSLRLREAAFKVFSANIVTWVLS